MLRDAARCPVLALHHLNKSGGFTGNRAITTRADLIIEGSDDEKPEYETRGRQLRARIDPIAQPFTISVEHENDDDDTMAATRITSGELQYIEAFDLRTERARERSARRLIYRGVLRRQDHGFGRVTSRRVDRCTFAPRRNGAAPLTLHRVAAPSRCRHTYCRLRNPCLPDTASSNSPWRRPCPPHNPRWSHIGKCPVRIRSRSRTRYRRYIRRRRPRKCARRRMRRRLRRRNTHRCCTGSALRNRCLWSIRVDSCTRPAKQT